MLFSEGPHAEVIQGVTIDYHPFWLALWSIHVRTGTNVDHFDSYYWWERISEQPIPKGPIDPEWRPNTWKQFCNYQGKQDDVPFIVKICVVPGADLKRLRPIYTIAEQQTSFFCTVEERPIARVAASVQGCAEMRADEPGTLGGFLRDKLSGRVFGLTCAHVASTVNGAVTLSDVGGSTHNNAGVVCYSTFATLNRMVGPGCNATITWQPDHVDIALIELDAIHTPTNKVSSVGVVDEVFTSSQFDSGSDVVMRGSVSGKHDYYVGAFAAIYRVLFNDGYYRCFNNMFQITSASGRAPWLPQKMATRPASGDSGSWVLCQNATGNYGYCGTLVAVDDLSGYACFAEAVTKWALDRHNLDLAPL